MIENPIQVDIETNIPERLLLESLTAEEMKREIVSLIHKGRWSKADLVLIQAKGD